MKKLLFIATTLLISSQANAAAGCKASDLNGNYVTYQAAINHHFHTGKCEININKGLLTGHCAFDPTVSGDANYNGPVNGTATINTNCSAVMSMNFGPVESNFDIQFTPDKNSYIGKFENNFGVQGTSSGTRYSPLLSPTPAPLFPNEDERN